MKKVVIAGTSVYGIENQGDEAMLNVFCRELRANLPDVEITLLARHPSKALDVFHGVKSIKNLEHNSKKESMGRWFNGLNPGDSTSHLREIRKAIEASDLLVIGGDPFAEISLSFYRGLAPYAALLITVAKFLEKPVMLYGIHMGRELKTDLGKELTKFCVSNSDLVTLREEFSRKAILDLGISDKNTVVLADTAFGLDPIENKEDGKQILDREGIQFKSDKVVGITFRHEYWKWNTSDWDYYSSILAEAYDYIVEELGVDLLFIPNCTYDIDHEYEDDRLVANDTVGKMKHKEHAHQVRNRYNLLETLSLFPHIDMMFSNRRHSLVFAAVNGVPPVGCGGEWHVKPALDELSVGDKFVKIEDLNADLLKKSLYETWTNRDQIIKNMRALLPKLREKALQHGKLAADLIKREGGRN